MTDRLSTSEITLPVLLQAIKDGTDALRDEIHQSEARQETRMSRLEARWEARFLDHERRIGVIEDSDIRAEALSEGRTSVLTLGRKVTLDMVSIIAVIISLAAVLIASQ